MKPLDLNSEMREDFLRKINFKGPGRINLVKKGREF